jgi:hypothetical protein
MKKVINYLKKKESVDKGFNYYISLENTFNILNRGEDCATQNINYPY